MSEKILVTGATGYIGGRLVPRLLEAGYQVRCLVRDATRLQGYSWCDRIEIKEGDALDLAELLDAMRGIKVTYYLIHGMQGMRPNTDRDLSAAHNFASAAEEAKL